MQDSFKYRSDGMVETITSPSNKTIKHIRSLMAKKYREEHHQFLVEGMKMVSEAMSSGLVVDMLVFSESFAKQQTEASPDAGAGRDICVSLQGNALIRGALEKGIRCIATTDGIFKSVSDTQTPQGILAVVREKEYDLDKAIGMATSFLVILDGIKDPGNLGTIIRTVDAVNGDGVVLIHDCVDPYNPKAVRSTMGSIFRVPVFQCRDVDGLVDKLTDSGYHIVTSHLNGSDMFCWPGGYSRTALVIGSESHGASRQMTDCADSLVKIPMAGGAESLNASVAAGILIYEIFRKGRKMDG